MEATAMFFGNPISGQIPDSVNLFSNEAFPWRNDVWSWLLLSC